MNKHQRAQVFVRRKEKLRRKMRIDALNSNASGAFVRELASNLEPDKYTALHLHEAFIAGFNSERRKS